jgi:Ca2+-binding EF-hand superfamily protein
MFDSLSYFTGAAEVPVDENVKAIFEKHDIDGIGALALNEFKEALVEMGEQDSSELNIRKLFMQADIEKCNTVNLKQFNQFCENHFLKKEASFTDSFAIPSFGISSPSFTAPDFGMTSGMSSMKFSMFGSDDETDSDIMDAKKVATPRGGSEPRPASRRPSAKRPSNSSVDTRGVTEPRPSTTMATKRPSAKRPSLKSSEMGRNPSLSAKVIEGSSLDGDSIMSKLNKNGSLSDAPPRRNNLTLDDVNVSASGGGVNTVMVDVPRDAVAGGYANFSFPGGRTFRLRVPANAVPGGRIAMDVPKKKPASSLTKEQVEKAQQVFTRIDFDGSGALDHNEVKMALQEMGMDSSSQTVADLIQEFDTDQNGTIDLEEFKVICANSPIGDFDWSHLDKNMLAKIEQSAKGIGQPYEGK